MPPRLLSGSVTSAIVGRRKKFDAGLGVECDDSEYGRATMYALLPRAHEEGKGMNCIF